MAAAGDRFGFLHHAIRIEKLLNADRQVGRAPAGLLKENRRGSGSLMLYPGQTGQAKFAENTSSSALLSSISAIMAVPPDSVSTSFKGFRQALCQIIPDFETVSHHFDGVFDLQFQFRRIRGSSDFPVDPRARI